jgi:dihydrofolate synthase/folylpolyglutamate synthase
VTAIEWLETLSPWPTDGFGTDRMRDLLMRLDDPQLAYPSIHVVGTNGKTTTTRAAARLLRLEGLHVGAYTSPHVRGWAERIQVDEQDADLEGALAEVRDDAEVLGATQFEVITAAALASFKHASVDVAVVEAGLGGRHDATNVLHSPVQVLTNVSLEHTGVLGDTREAIAAEKLAVVQRGATVVVGEPEWEELARANGAARVVVEPGGNVALARAAASAFLGRRVEHEVGDLRLPGRLERRGNELWDGAHTPAGVEYLSRRLDDRRYVLCVSILADKDVDAMLAALSHLGDTIVATRSSNPRALSAEELAARAEPYFQHVEAVEEADAARARARELAGREGDVLVTGSLYLLADLSARE